MVIIVLCCLLAKSNYNNGLIKNDTVNYKTVTSKNEAIDAAMIPETIVKNFTKIKTITKTINTVRIDTVKIVYKDTVECVFNRSGRLKSDYYSFDYLSNNKGFKIANLEIPDSLTVVTGQKRKWFLRAPMLCNMPIAWSRSCACSSRVRLSSQLWA